MHMIKTRSITSMKLYQLIVETVQFNSNDFISTLYALSDSTDAIRILN